MRSQLCAITLVLVLGAVTLVTAGGADDRKRQRCIRRCAGCAEKFGKKLYDGALCAHNCDVTKGAAVDEDCGDSVFHLIKRKSMKSELCKKYCVLCMARYGKDFYDGKRCYVACQMSEGRSVDVECENTQFHKIANN